VNRLASLVVLQDENARALWIVRVTFKRYCRCQAVDDLSDRNMVCGELIVAVG
jgi:hypothetical protein